MSTRLEGRVRVLTGSGTGLSTPVLAVDRHGALVLDSEPSAAEAEVHVAKTDPHAPTVQGQRTRSAVDRRRHYRAFWMVAFAFLSVTAFSGVPNPLYGLYRARDHFSVFMVTVIYAVYVVGVLGSLVFAGHLSDWYGRRRLLVPALVVAIISAVVFVSSKSLPGLLVGRLINGIAIGVVVSTATAYLTELHAVGRPDAPPGRAQVIASTIPFGGLGVGALMAGLLAEWVAYPLTVPYLVFLAALVVAAIGVALSPETQPGPDPRPRYRPQRVSIPHDERPTFFATALIGFMTFAAVGLFTGLSATFLATTFHHSSVALAGILLGVMFGSGVVVQTLTARWPIAREFELGVAAILVGLGLGCLAVWLSPPPLALFIVAGALIGAGGGGAIFRGAVATVIRIAPPDRIAESLAGLFLATYIGLSLPVVGAGVLLSRHISPEDVLLGFSIAVSIGIAASTIWLLGRKRIPDGGQPPKRRAADPSDREHNDHPMDNPNERRAA